jgi:hypothetical protein
MGALPHHAAAARSVGLRSSAGGALLDLQHDRIREACAALKLDSLAELYPQLATKAVANQLTFADFLEGLLKAEL